MSIIALLVIIALIGLVAWALVTYIPMPSGIRTTIVVIAVIIVVLMVLSALGVLDDIRGAQVPRL